MVVNVLYAPEESEASEEREQSERILGEHKIRFQVVSWSPDDPERRETVCLISSLGEFIGLEGITFYANQYRRLKSLAVKRAFEACAARWLQETKHCATIYESTKHPAFEKILSMGESVVPLILSHLHRRAEHWCWALTEITHENPAENANGDIEAIRQAWLEWGRQRGLL